MSFEIQSRAMLANLTIRQWSARKHDKLATRETNARFHVSSDAGRYHKRLLGRDALARIQSAASAARLEHYKRTLPWTDEGARILSASGFLEYSTTIRGLKQLFDIAVRDFAATYPSHVEFARYQLGDLFSESDYPRVEQIESKFAIESNILPMPAAEDFRVDLPNDILGAVEESIEANVRNSLERANRDIYERINERVGKLAESLAAYKPKRNGSGPENIFRDSLISNVRELCGIIPSLNFTGNSDIASLVKRLDDIVAADADDFRNDDALRSATVKDAQSILDHVSQFLA